MEKRTFLKAIGAGGITAIAGCSGSGDNNTSSGGDSSGEDGSGEGSSGEDSSGEESSGEDSSGEDSNKNTENGAETRTHEVGETFTVGEGDRVIQYTVDSMRGVDSLGSDYSREEADGQFVVVEMTIENKSGQSFNISSNKFAIIAGPEGEEGSLYEPSDDVTIAYNSDERFDTESILYEQLNPDLPTEGAVVFDIPQDVTLIFRVEPAGFLDTSDPHFVLPPE